MEKIGPLVMGNSSLFSTPLVVITLATAASLIGESLEDTLKLVYGGHLQGFLPFEKGKTWHVLVASLERWLGQPIRIIQREEE